MIFNFVMLESVLTPTLHAETCLPNPEHLQLRIRDALTVFDFMSRIDILDHDLNKPDWDPWRYNFGSHRANKLAHHVQDGALISPPPTAEELVTTRKLLEQYALIPSIESPIPGKVPGFKFTIDEFWCITPRECLIISQRFRPMEESGEIREYIYTTTTADSCWEYHFNCESDCELMSMWITFNELAALHGGYCIA